MRRTQLFLPTLKETPSEAQIVSHRLMLRAGLVRQSAAGIYTWLPAGYRVLRKIEQIVREEQDRAGAQEVLMPTIQSRRLCGSSRGAMTTTARKCCASTDRHGREMLYGPTNGGGDHRDLPRLEIKSYRDLPKHALSTSSGSSATKCGRASA